MNPALMEQAEELAKRPYTVRISFEETTHGAPIHVAYCPELDGCMGQGETAERALANLAEARADYIYSLFEGGLPVLEPKSLETTTTSSPFSEPVMLKTANAETENQPSEAVLLVLQPKTA